MVPDESTPPASETEGSVSSSGSFKTCFESEEYVLGSGFFATYFQNASDLTEALSGCLTEVVATSSIMDRLAPNLQGDIRITMRNDSYRAASKVVGVAADPQRSDLQREILSFLEYRTRLHRHLRYVPAHWSKGPTGDSAKMKKAYRPAPASFELRKILRDELNPVDDNLHSSTLKGCLADTRLRVLEDLRALVDETSQRGGKHVIWLKGVAGAGKTSVMFTLAQELRNDQTSLVSNFYCSRGDTVRSDPRRILPTLAFDLGQCNADVGEALQQAMTGRTKVTAPVQQMQRLILRPLEEARVGPAVILIDGLDECGNDDGVEQLLDAVTLGVEEACSLVVVIASRPLKGVAGRLDGVAVALDLNDIAYKSPTREDVATYLHGQLTKTRLAPLLARPDGYEEVVSQLVQSADGNFIVASFMCSAILRGVSSRDFLAKILAHRKVITSASSLYAHFLSAIESASAGSDWRGEDLFRAAKHIFGMLCCAQEPMTSTCMAQLAELGEDLVCDTLKALAPLLLSSDGRWTFFHASVADFLQSDHASKYRVVSADKHGDLALACMALLRRRLDFNSARIRHLASALDRELASAPPFELDYAASSWAQHLSASSASPVSMRPLIDDFLRRRFLFWLEILSVMGRVLSHGVDGLNKVVSFLGLQPGGHDFVADCQRCLHLHNGDISKGPSWVYVALLPWLPRYFRLQLEERAPWLASFIPQAIVGAPERWSREISIWRFSSVVQSVAFSPDGTMVALANFSEVIVCSAQTGRPLQCYDEAARCVAFSPDGSTIAAATDSGTVWLWSVQTGKSLREPLVGHNGAVLSVAFNPNGFQIASGSTDHTIRLWSLLADQVRSESWHGHTGPVTSLAFDSVGRRVVSGSKDRTVRIWDAATGSQQGRALAGHQAAVTSVAFSTDGLMIASGSEDGEAQLWRSSGAGFRGESLQGQRQYATSVAFSSDGLLLASGSMWGLLHVWDLSTNIPSCSTIEQDSVRSIAFSPDSYILATGSGDATVRLWDANTVRHKSVAASETDGVAALGPRMLASGSRSDTPAYLSANVDKQHLDERVRRHFSRLVGNALSPDGSMMVTVSSDKTLLRWNARKAEPKGKPSHCQDELTGLLAFSADGSTIASAMSSGAIQLWSSESGDRLGEPFARNGLHTGNLTFSSNGLELISTSYGRSERMIRFWSLQTRQPKAEPLLGHEVVAFSHDRLAFASRSGENLVQVWDTQTVTPWTRPSGLRGHARFSLDFALSPDGLTIATGSNDGRVRLWCAKTGELRAELRGGHTAQIRVLAFNHEGNVLASGSLDHMVSFWNVQACEAYGKALAVHTGALNEIRFSADDTRATTRSTCDVIGWGLSNLRHSSASSTGHSITSTVLACLPNAYFPEEYSPTTHVVVGHYGTSRGLFILPLPSDDPWKTLCDAHAEYRRDHPLAAD